MRSAFKVILTLFLIPVALFLWILQLFLFAGIFSISQAGSKPEKAASKRKEDGSPDTEKQAVILNKW
jgi:hypothetical protein